MKSYSPILISLFISSLLLACQPGNQAKSQTADYITEFNIDYLAVSENYLITLKEKGNAEPFREKVAKINADSLAQFLNSPIKKKVFWINLYNAFIQDLLSRNPELYEDRSSFFSKKQLKVAGEEISFDQIEHGILRGAKWKLSLGYINDPFISDFEKSFIVEKLDYRIHFALNCGASSCPPIAIYTLDNFEDLIEQLAEKFLQGVSSYDSTENEVKTTALFSWFRADFGGKEGILNTLSRYGVIEAGQSPDLEYQEYDWSLKLDYYYEP